MRQRRSWRRRWFVPVILVLAALTGVPAHAAAGSEDAVQSAVGTKPHRRPRTLRTSQHGQRPPPASDNASIIDVKNRLAEKINPRTCLPLTDAQRLAEQALDSVGLDDWTVAISQPPTDQRPCPSLSYDHATRRILLVPVPHTGP